MYRLRALWFMIIVLGAASLACNAFAGSLEPTLPPPPTVDAQATATPGEGGPAATATLPGDGEATSEAVEGPTATVLVNLNVRRGPSTSYDTVGYLLEGESVRITGRAPGGDWWQIECPPRAEGTDCWISGRPQFSTAVNTETVAEVQPPPTPTPRPAGVEPGEPLLVYVSDGRLWAANLDTGQTPPALTGDPVQLGNNNDVTWAQIAPDGRKIAYLTGADTANQLWIINTDGRGMAVLADSTQLPGGDADLVVLIDKVEWLADSQTLAFNTAVVNTVGPGRGSQLDLWTVALDGQPMQRFAPGSGGGDFAVSVNNQVILSRGDGIVRADIDGTNAQTVVTFPRINTASEYVYYPPPQWRSDGGQAYVAVPSEEPFSGDATVQLYHIPPSGGSLAAGQLRGNILFDPVFWKPNGTTLAYVQRLMNSSQTPTLILTDGRGQNPFPYREGEQLSFFEWSSNNDNFLFAGADYYAIGRIGDPPTILSTPGGQRAGDGQWLTADTFITAVGSTDARTWTFSSGHREGETADLAITAADFQPMFDVWAP